MMLGRPFVPVPRPRCAVVLVCITWMLMAVAASAHEVRPAYLELQEEQAGEFDVLFKTPMRGDMRLSLTPQFSGRIEAVVPISARATGDAAVQVWRVRAVDPLRGQTVRIDGLESTMTDALIRVSFADGSSWLHRVTPQQPEVQVPLRPDGLSIAITYLKLGVEHILLGIDHLLFVLGLLLITRGTWRLIKTVTAFTVAHSITLALATIGYIHVPPAPVEALIALSIVFVAVEVVHLQRGREGLTARMPWLVAFVFGLLHGLGFAGALSKVGLPAGHVPTALLFFNIGVEIGQLIFIAAVLGLMFAIRRGRILLPRSAEMAAPYAIGIVAMFWVFERVAEF